MSSTPPTLSTTPHQPSSLPNSPSVKRPRIMSPNETSTPVAPLSASPPLLIKKISPTARTPTRGSVYAAGYDLYASEATTIPARGRKLVSTGLQMAVVEGCCESPMLRANPSRRMFIPGTGAGETTLRVSRGEKEDSSRFNY